MRKGLVFLYFLLSFEITSFGQNNTKQQKEVEKKQNKLKKDALKARKKDLKMHLKMQDKKTKRRMKKMKVKSSTGNRSKKWRFKKRDQ